MEGDLSLREKRYWLLPPLHLGSLVVRRRLNPFFFILLRLVGGAGGPAASRPLLAPAPPTNSPQSRSTPRPTPLRLSKPGSRGTSHSRGCQPGPVSLARAQNCHRA